MSSGRIDFGEYLLELRTSAGYSQKKVADKLGIDVSMLSKIEHGKRQVQGHMLKFIAELFDLDFKEIQIQFLNQKINEQYGEEPYFNETVKTLTKNKK